MEETVATNGAAGGGLVMIIQLAILILVVAGMWKVFLKAGQPGWAAIIPIYNAYVFLKVAGKPGWWLILLFVPIVNIVVAIIALAGLASNFGKGAGYVLGLLFLPFIFYPMLGFGSAEYTPAGSLAAGTPEPPSQGPATVEAQQPEEPRKEE